MLIPTSRVEGTPDWRDGYLPDSFGRFIMRSVLLWAIGIPLPIILILWLLSGHA